MHIGDEIWWCSLVMHVGDEIWWCNVVMQFGVAIWWSSLVMQFGDAIWWSNLIKQFGEVIWWSNLVVQIGVAIWWGNLVKQFGDPINNAIWWCLGKKKKIVHPWKIVLFAPTNWFNKFYFLDVKCQSYKTTFISKIMKSVQKMSCIIHPYTNGNKFFAPVGEGGSPHPLHDKKKEA